MLSVCCKSAVSDSGYCMKCGTDLEEMRVVIGTRHDGTMYRRKFDSARRFAALELFERLVNRSKVFVCVRMEDGLGRVIS